MEIAMLITNPVFSEIEKTYLEFVLCHDFSQKADVVTQLNNMKADEITRDVKPTYWIIEFRPNGINPGCGPMCSCITIQVSHRTACAPTIFTLYERGGFVYELEIYNGDSSVLDFDTIMLGDITVFPTA